MNKNSAVATRAANQNHICRRAEADTKIALAIVPALPTTGFCSGGLLLSELDFAKFQPFERWLSARILRFCRLRRV